MRVVMHWPTELISTEEGIALYARSTDLATIFQH